MSKELEHAYFRGILEGVATSRLALYAQPRINALNLSLDEFLNASSVISKEALNQAMPILKALCAIKADVPDANEAEIRGYQEQLLWDLANVDISDADRRQLVELINVMMGMSFEDVRATISDMCEVYGYDILESSTGLGK